MKDLLGFLICRWWLFERE